jgi:hypothetical protein
MLNRTNQTLSAHRTLLNLGLTVRANAVNVVVPVRAALDQAPFPYAALMRFGLIDPAVGIPIRDPQRRGRSPSSPGGTGWFHLERPVVEAVAELPPVEQEVVRTWPAGQPGGRPRPGRLGPPTAPRAQAAVAAATCSASTCLAGKRRARG